MYHPNAECVVATMKLCSIFCVVAPSLRRQNIKRGMMLLGGSFTGSWEVCKEYGVECSDKWYEHSPKGVEENEEVKLLWDFTIQTDREIHHRRPDIVIQKKKAKETIIVDIAVPGDSNILQKETEKCEKYQDLAREIQRIWKSKVVSVVVGALGSVSKKLAGHLEQLGIKNRTRTMQKSALLGSEHIHRKVLEV